MTANERKWRMKAPALGRAVSPRPPGSEGSGVAALWARAPYPMWKEKAMKKGFTLVEMLVVIAILGILMAMMVPAAGMILRRARVAQAKADAGVVTTVMMKYHAEYNRWPDFYKTEAEQDQPHLTDGGWVSVMSPAPRQVGDPPSADNFKGIVFFSPGGGVLGDADSAYPGGFLDPWGNAFEYQVDADQDESIGHPSGEGTIRARAIAWSRGPDGKSETWEDNATSWE